MRKKNYSYIIDETAWWLIYLLPVLVYMILSFRQTPEVAYEFFMGFSEIENNLIYTGFAAVFGESGALPLFTGQLNIILYYATYFVSMIILHVMLDVLAFIPRFSHDLMSKITGVCNE